MQKFIMWLSIMAAVALAVLNMTYQFSPEPDAVYPIADQNITWNYAGK